MLNRFRLAALVLSLGLVAPAAGAQSLGTLRWQLQPYCNVITVNVTQQGAVYTLDGYDDQCGAGQRAPLVGLATPNPDGSIGFGMNVVTVPGGRGVQIEARITLATLGGPWTDSAGYSGTFAFGVSSGGNQRPPPPAPASTIPSLFSLRTDGGLLANGAFGFGSIPAAGAGTRMMWFPAKAAFRAGTVVGSQWNDADIGDQSVAFNLNTRAVGSYSAAFGEGTNALGRSSVAVGFATTANGLYSLASGHLTQAIGNESAAFNKATVAYGVFSVAFGDSSQAIGTASTAMGYFTTASGERSTAMGNGTVASGAYSTAMGSATTAGGSHSAAMGLQSTANGDSAIAIGFRLNANGAGNVVLGSDASSVTAGNFMFGDRSTATDLTTAGSNEFLVRAAGGTIFYSNAAMTTGVILTPGTTTWQSLGVSDENRKTDFRDLDGEHVLSQLAAMPVREWRYTTQDAGIRHVGPTAQDFRAAFALGESDVRIGSVDADGIALAAVKALEARTRDSAVLRERLTALEEVNAELLARLARLEALLERR